MRVDTAYLRMGADFSVSAGAIARRGVDEFASAALTTGMFGDFEEAEQFHRALSEMQSKHTKSMQGHHSALTTLAEKAVTAAKVFTEQDEQCASAVESAQRGFIA
ncbi:DUF2563 domain-containing protein [Mycolicibacterium sp. GF69]|uniref:DUF2563 family protein n=1 Tax=Mycolicibacterium sp. GF69 TaxID=2267251 RepID=UPI000DCE4887|nr:DUF2563 family protein [Mycolicibacterium sp. GF69]RAV18002.1 DUF2563 domain-containing protein [Mycolicibacterium sp. GF69]